MPPDLVPNSMESGRLSPTSSARDSSSLCKGFQLALQAVGWSLRVTHLLTGDDGMARNPSIWKMEAEGSAQNKNKKRAGEAAQLAEHLLNTCKALGSVPSTS